jgi:hypothetical protein
MPIVSFDASVELKSDSIQEVLDLIESLSKNKRFVVVFDEFQDILKIKAAGNITGDIQQLCEALWEVTPQEGEVSPHKLRAALELIFAREQKSYEAFVSLLTDLQLKWKYGKLSVVNGKTAEVPPKS